MLLAIDTSGPFCSAALYDQLSSSIVALKQDNIGRGHAEHLMPMLEDLMASAGQQWCEIDHVVSVTGPGSFTGVRVGLAAAKGLSLGLNIKSSGVSVFQAFAHELLADRPLAVMLDAKRSEIWLQMFETTGKPGCEPTAVQQSEALRLISESHELSKVNFAGAGVRLALDACQISNEINVVNEALSPDIEFVAKFAADRPIAASSLTPLYIRAPDAKPQPAEVLT